MPNQHRYGNSIQMIDDGERISMTIVNVFVTSLVVSPVLQMVTLLFMVSVMHKMKGIPLSAILLINTDKKHGRPVPGIKRPQCRDECNISAKGLYLT